MQCSIAQTLDVVGDPWTLLVVRDAMFGTRRFDEFQRSLGIPRNTLTQRLRTLVDHGVLERRRYQEHPERYEYVLTDKGRALDHVLVSMLQWGDRWSDLDEPPVTLVDERTGDAVEPVYVDRNSGTPLSQLRITRRFNAAD
jgi:DNA-binding HxlR family transcriptional regulator